METQRRGSVNSVLSHASLQQDFNHLDIHPNCPEKIILCIDLAEDVSTTKVYSKEKGELPLLDVWKNALQLFVWNKHLISKKHEFAIVILNEKAQWFCDFNSKPEDVCKVISDLQSDGKEYDSFETASLYSIIYENSPPPPPSENPLLPPPFIVRSILLYGRCLSMPVYRGDVKAHEELMESPYFFMDILYAHPPPSPANMCQGIFDILAELYPKPKALVLDWSFNITQLFNCFAKLLAHPMQRPIQTHMEHKLQT